MIAKNGIDWTAMGFTVYGECPEYGSTKRKRNNVSHESKRNISFTPAYRLWANLLQRDRGNEWSKIILCEEWKNFENFEKWYNENYYDVGDDNMSFLCNLFDPENIYASPETCCFLPHSIKTKNRRDARLKGLVEKYNDFLPEKVRIYYENYYKAVTNGKVE